MTDEPTPVCIGERVISRREAPYVIAEVSANHLGSKRLALDIVAAAADAGADAVKFQHYTPDTISVRSRHPDFVVGGGTPWDGRELADLYGEAMMPWEWTDDLVAHASAHGIDWLSSPFDDTAVDFLDSAGVPAFKIASFEIVDLPLIEHAASKGKPLVISTGMASVGEIDAAVQAALRGGAPGVVLLRCNSGYPADPTELDLRAIPVMAELWGVPVGFSDHTPGHTSAVVSVALGACVIEKHITLDRSQGGPDSDFSLEPGELAALVSAVREAHAALGAPRFGPSEREKGSLRLRPSIRVVSAVRAGEALTSENVASIRPAGGLSPAELPTVLGMVAAHDLDVGDPVRWQDLRPEADDER